MHDGKVLEITRRHFFGGAGFGIGSLALAALMDEKLLARGQSMRWAEPDTPRAKNVIFLFMAGDCNLTCLTITQTQPTRWRAVPKDLMKGGASRSSRRSQASGHAVSFRPARAARRGVVQSSAAPCLRG
jgi:hypothetical protein